MIAGSWSNFDKLRPRNKKEVSASFALTIKKRFQFNALRFFCFLSGLAHRQRFFYGCKSMKLRGISPYMAQDVVFFFWPPTTSCWPLKCKSSILRDALTGCGRSSYLVLLQNIGGTTLPRATRTKQYPHTRQPSLVWQDSYVLKPNIPPHSLLPTLKINPNRKVERAHEN